MIVTLTLNPALDKCTDTAQLLPEKKLRCGEMLVEAGGGGINVSKAIKELGGESVAVFPCGGVNGEMIERLLRKKRMAIKPVSVNGDTRENIVVNETATGRQYRFVMPGPVVSSAELKEIEEKAFSIPDTSFLVCSGSLPAGVDASFFGRMAAIAKERGLKLVADTSGAPLQTVMEQGAYLVKPNLSELCLLAGKAYLEPAEIAGAAKSVLQRSACEAMVVSMGPSGALLVTKDDARTFTAPTVKKQTTVGAGDSMVAGIVWMLEKGEPLQNAVQFGIACGTAATISRGTQLFKKEDALRYYAWMTGSEV